MRATFGDMFYFQTSLNHVYLEQTVELTAELTHGIWTCSASITQTVITLYIVAKTTIQHVSQGRFLRMGCHQNT